MIDVVALLTDENAPLYLFIGVAFLFMIGFAGTAFGDELIDASVRLFRRVRTRIHGTGPGVVAYKKADIRQLRIIYGEQERIHLELRGVTGTPYIADDEATSRQGFHAYRELSEARSHAQDGDVLLEVLISGEVDDLDKGFVATHQRVLQVLVDTDRADVARRHPALRRLLGHGWIDQHGTRIVVAPLRSTKAGRTTCEAFVPTSMPGPTATEA
ncbi:hypothetical protein [Brevibacterium oceani]|uniref:hypothetical protein n=1 Tax=Brevibacterium oceani TaxID=358099 RepID=UPI0015E6E8A6|nr:hypothetical protein [Brevibacterium oceani]